MRSIDAISDSPAKVTPVSSGSSAEDLRAQLGWQRLLEYVLEAVLAQPSDSIPQSSRPAVLLTLVTYCYATRTFGSEDIEDATKERPEVAYVTRGMPVTAADIRQFRRHHRARIENCLAQVLNLAMAELVREGKGDNQLATAWEQGGLARSWVSQAVLFDTAFSE
jgi:hypothetical protein